MKKAEGRNAWKFTTAGGWRRSFSVRTGNRRKEETREKEQQPGGWRRSFSEHKNEKHLVGFRTIIWRVYWTYVRLKLLANILAGSISRLLLPVDYHCQYILSQYSVLRIMLVSYEEHVITTRIFSVHLLLLQKPWTLSLDGCMLQSLVSQSVVGERKLTGVYSMYLIGKSLYVRSSLSSTAVRFCSPQIGLNIFDEVT